MIRLSWILGVLLAHILIAGSGCEPKNAPTRRTEGGWTPPPEVVSPADLIPSILDVQTHGLHKLEVKAPSGKIVKYAIWIPKELPVNRKVPLVIALHPSHRTTPHYGAAFIELLYAPACESIGAVIVAPDSMSSGEWDDQITLDHVAWLTRSVTMSYAIDDRKVVLSGYSAGGIGTWFLAARSGKLYSAAVPIAGEPKVRGAIITVPLCAVHSKVDGICLIGPTKLAVEAQIKAGHKAHLIALTDGTGHAPAKSYVKPLREAMAWVAENWN